VPDRRGVVCSDVRGVAAPCAAPSRNEPEAFLYAFDLLELNGADLRKEPIEVRKRTLASILRKAPNGARGRRRLQHACKMGLEGIVSKRVGSRDRSGRSPDWL
jgi:bifunctional non-homologous end joining protein LigD